MRDLIMWFKCHFLGHTPDCVEEEGYQEFRGALHDHRNTTMAASGTLKEEIRSSRRMLKVSNDAIAHLERIRDHDAQAH